MVIFKKNTYKDIFELYNIQKITDECIEVCINKIKKKVYIYEISPITILNISDEIVSNITNIYTEFLRELEIEFQILVSNQKLDVEKYIKDFMQFIDIDKNMSEIYVEYIEDIKKKLYDEQLYNTKYYIITYIKNTSIKKEKEIMATLCKLKQIGCNVKRIIGRNNLLKIMYNSINKEFI